LVQIQDGNGITVSLSWITGSLSAGQSFSPSVSWIPKEPGTYTATAFHWISIDNPTAISPPVSTRITVIGPPDPNLKKIELLGAQVGIYFNSKTLGSIIDVDDLDKYYGFSISGKIVNREKTSNVLTFFVTVKDENQNPIFTSFNTKTIDRKNSESFGVRWLPTFAGTYYIDAVVWDNPQNQNIIDGPISIQIELVDKNGSYTIPPLDFNSTYELEFENQTYDIQFKNIGAHLTKITKDESSLTLTLEKAYSGWLNIAIPKNLLDAKSIDGNDFAVKIDGLLVPHNETFEENQRVLNISINRGNEEIEITPVYIVDEE